jgi:hypothetical protein
MFVTMSLLWSLWSTESVTTWLSLWPAARSWSTGGPSWMLRSAGGAMSRGALHDRGVQELVRVARDDRVRAEVGEASSRRVRLLALSTSIVYKRLGPAGDMIAALRHGGLNQETCSVSSVATTRTSWAIG